MENWIDQNRDELWEWIEGCFNKLKDYSECLPCPNKDACDAIWDKIKIQ